MRIYFPTYFVAFYLTKNVSVITAFRTLKILLNVIKNGIKILNLMIPRTRNFQKQPPGMFCKEGFLKNLIHGEKPMPESIFNKLQAEGQEF